MRHVSIVGAGPVGTVMALLLARRGTRVQLYERRPDPRHVAAERGRSINLALAARGLRALAEAGVLREVLDATVTMPGRLLHDTDGGLQFMRYGRDVDEVIHAISRERLNRLLIEAAARTPGISLLFDTHCSDVDPIRGELQLHTAANSQPFSAPFEQLLAADGAGSAVRTAMVARGLTQVHDTALDHDYKELLIAPRAAHDGPGYVFEPHALHIWPRGGHMLIALPNTDGSFTATLFLARSGTPSFEQLKTDADVQRFFADEFPDALAVLPDLTQQFRSHPQGRLGSVHCSGWQHAGRVLLLGDAAHAIVPFHGQGLNCGFEDCRVLDQLLQQPGDTATAFVEFERRRRPDTEAIAAMALENYLEMRDGVRDPRFQQRRVLAAELERAFPDRFVPRYSMVMFHAEIPYAEAQRRGEQQQRLLDVLMEGLSPDATGLTASQLATAARWLDGVEPVR